MVTRLIVIIAGVMTPSPPTRSICDENLCFFTCILVVVLTDIGDNLAYRHGLHSCEEVYPYRNQHEV
jgi:hypothetical protein